MPNSYLKAKLGNILRLNPDRGFTIVELVVVISIIGILSTIVVFSYGGWRQSTVVAQLKSDLNGLVASMEDARNFSNSYPSTYPSSTFKASKGVTITGGSTDGVSYCFNAVSSDIPTLYYNIDSVNKSSGAQLGKCATYSMSFVANGGSAVNTLLDIAKGSTVTSPADPTKSSNIFSGWYKEAGLINQWNFGADKVNSDTTLYAKWVPDPWISGVISGIKVYNVDLPGTYKWGLSSVLCPNTYCYTPPSQTYRLFLSPQTNPGVEFSPEYPAQAACKQQVGGRLPDIFELLSIQQNKTSLGNNFQSNYYQSSRQYNDSRAQTRSMYDGFINNMIKSDPYYVRCVKD